MAPKPKVGHCPPPPSIEKFTFLAPASPSSKRHLFLSSIDIHWRDLHYNKRLLFYPNITTTTTYHDAIHTLKTSLSIVLVDYFPWAGRLALDSHGRLVIDCNGAGVEFVEASIDSPMSDISQEGFPMMPIYDKLCRDVDHAGDRLYTCPLLSIQVTRFTDGGIALGMSYSHVVADGKSLWDFMVAWGECARGHHVHGPMPRPVHERERLALNGPPSEEEANRYRAKMPKCRSEAFDPPNAASMQCVFVLPERSIKKLKAEAGGSYTTYEVLCAHFWRKVSEARKSSRDTKVRFMVVANLRSKMEPPLSPSYFGNVIHLATAYALTGDLLDEELGRTAGRIHEAILGCTRESLVSCLHWLELHGNSFEEIRNDSAGYEMMGVVSSPRFPVYDVEFGWGRPDAVRPAKVRGNGEMVLFGGRLGSGDIEICMALPCNAMEGLLSDPTFLAKPVSNPFYYYN